MRFTLGKMFLAVGMLALACAGMMYRSELWVGGITMFTWLLFVWAGVQATIQHQRTRVTWIAFFMAGVSYLLLSGSEWYGPKLLTNVPLAIASQKLEVGAKFSGPGAWKSIYSEAYGIRWTNVIPQLREFFLIGHCVFSWLFAVLAAWLAGRMWDRCDRAAKEAV
jgi:hypothetical protein